MRSSVTIIGLLGVVISGLAAPVAHSAPAPSPSPAPAIGTAAPGVATWLHSRQGPSEQGQDEVAIRALLERYFSAWATKDFDGLAKCWFSDTPDSSILTDAVTQTRRKDVEFSALTITRLVVGDGEATARVSVSVAATDRATRQIERRTWIKAFSFRRADGEWRVSREVAAVSDLVAQLKSLPSFAERTALLDKEPDLVGEPLRRALESDADWVIGQGQTPEGLALLDLAVAVARRSGDRATEAAALANLALRNRLARKWQAAIDGYNDALAIYAAIPNPGKVAATEVGLGGVYYSSTDYTTAGEHYQRALTIYEATGDADAAASTWHSLGNVAYLAGDWVTALKHYSKSVEIQEALAASAGANETALRKQGVANAYHAIGMVQQELGDYPEAEKAFLTSLARSTAADDSGGILRTNEALGTLYRLQQDYAASLRYYLVAIRLNERGPSRAKDVALDATLLAKVGDVYAMEQRFPTGLDYLKKSLSLYEQLKNEQGVASVLSGIGAIYFAQRSYDLALDHDRRALERYEALHDQEATALMRLRIGLVLAAQGQHEAALAEFQRALSLMETSKDRQTKAALLVLASAEHAALDHSQEALDLAQNAMTLAVDSSAFDVLSQSHLVAGEVYRRRGDIDRATREVADAITARERFRGTPSVGADDAFFPEGTPPYLAMVDLLARQGKLIEAFEMSERARVVRFQELLGDETVVAKGMTPEERAGERRLRNQEQSLRRQVQLANVKRRDDMNAERRALLDHALADAVMARQRFNEGLYSSHPGLKQLRGREAPAMLSAAVSVLDSSTALLAYTITESRSYLFVLTTESAPSPSTGSAQLPVPEVAAPAVRAYPIEITPTELQRRVLALRDLIVRQAPVGAAARDLYDLLVKPAEAQLAGRRRLLIVPDGALWALPIQALQPRDGRYVIEDYAVAYGASLTAIVAMNRTDKLTRAPASPAKRLVAVGLGEPDKTALEELALLRPDLRFEPLRYAEAEGRAVTAGLPSGAGILLTGRDARQSRVVAEARGATTLHLAVPGVLNDASPTHSLLAFAPGNDNCDCLVDTSMVMALDQSATVVVLSRLYGEPGQLGPGAGVTMMAWAWFVAGAPTTVLTQWLVDAPSTNTLMAGFHRSLATPPAGGAHPASAALQRATLQLLRGQAVHPFYWAGFVVMGDAR